VIEVQRTQGAFEAGADQRSDTGVRLRDEQKAVAAGGEGRSPVAKRTAAEAAPVEIVHAQVEGLLHSGSGRAIAGGQAQPADWDAGAAEDGGVQRQRFDFKSGP